MGEKLNESDLLERVFLRLGHADSDKKLEEFATRFLTPVLLKLSSPNEDVKKKVLELLAHVNRRFKNRERVPLPMDSLFLQYQDPLCTPYVRNFTILYLRMSFLRLNTEKQLHYLPQLFLCMKEKPKPQQDCLLQLAVPVLALFSSDESSSVIMKELHVVIGKDKSISESFLSFVLDVLLVPYSAFSSKVTDVQNTPVPPGLSRSTLQRILAGSLTLDNLEKVKMGILRFLSADLFESLAIQVHLVVAMGDSRHSVLGYAEHQLKIITEASNWEHTSVVSKLMAIYLGTITLPGKPPIPPDDVRIPASLSLRLKIFPFLLKSRKSAHVFPACLQLIFQSLHGETSDKKLRLFAVQFIHHLCECSSDKIMTVVSPVLLSTLLKLVAKNEEPSLQKITYLAIGKISKRSPSLFQKDTAVVQILFDALAHCVDPEIALVVMQSLTMVAAALKDASLSTLGLIEALILSNISQEQPHCRLAALQVANILFPTTHVKSRYACLVASADKRDDIKEEANKGLLFHIASSDKGSAETGNVLPELTEMLRYIYQTVHGANGYTQSYVTVAGSLAYPPNVFIKVLTYLRRCLKSSAGVTQDDEVNDQALVPIKRYIQQILNTHPSVINQYLSLIQEALKPIATSELHSLALNSLLELLVTAPSRLGPELNQNGTMWLKDFVWSSQDVIRHTSSHVLAILACLSGKENVLNEIKQLLEAIESSSETIQHGTVICCGHLIGQYLAQQNGDNSLDGLEMNVDDVEGSEMSDTPMDEVVTKAFKAIVRFLGSPSSLLVHAACDAIGEVCRHGSIPLPDGTPLCDEDETNQATNKDKDVSRKCETKLDIVHQLAQIMNNSKEQKLCEKSVLILGLLCIEHFPHRNAAIEKLLDASKKREIDMQFIVGEALSCAGAGRFSTASRSKWYAGGTSSEEMPNTKDTMRWLLCKIFNDFIGSNVAHVRKAACIWLLVILKHASKHSVVQEMMGEIQQAFTAMLSENDELVQETASKGLSLVYEFGSEEFRKSMVSSLVNAMLSGKKRMQNVTSDTKVLALDRVPTGDGSHLLTYKELCSLASDMNQPELVYRFMHLANHNAMWNSKKGAAFGFASIGVQAKKELEPHLKTLVPKLYRYQFDPNSKVREAMLSIWAAIVKEPRKIIDQYSQEILDELLANLHDPAWRVRQSCCIAVSNFLNGRSLAALIDYLPQLWGMCLRDMDDIKESVRKAAEVACKTLQSVSVRFCDVAQGKIGQQAVGVLLPVLLKQGLDTRVKEVRNLGLETIVKISKNAGSLLKPHIPVLVSALLESLSGLEPQALNYVSFHMQNNPDNQEKLDDIRIGASKSSPMMETITLCVQHVDSTVLPELIPRLADLLRSGLGLGTKAGCAGLVVSLVQQCAQELQPYAGKLLSALLSGMTDKSQSVRRKYADAIGQLARVAKDSSVSKLFAKMKVWYLEKEDPIQGACGLVCYAIARSAPDVLSHHAATMLPLAFVAMHRKTDDGKKSPWEDIWSDNTSGTARGIQLYLEEIVSISSSMLSSQSWERKVEAAQSIQTLVRVLHMALPKSNLDSLVSALTSSLSGRTWDGKENVVSCLASLYSKCYELLDETAIQGIVGAILKECRKEKPAYKAIAIKCLGQILQKKKDHDFKEVFDILKPIVDPDDDEPSSTQDDKVQSPDANLLINAFECLGLAWPADRLQQIEYRDKVLSIFVAALTKNTWKIQLAVLESLKQFIKVISIVEETVEDSVFIQDLVSVVLPEICQCLGNIKYAAIRVKSLELTQSVMSLIEMQKSSNGSAEQISLMKELAGKISLLRNDNNANVVEKAIELKSIVEKVIVEKAIVEKVIVENSDSLMNME